MLLVVVVVCWVYLLFLLLPLLIQRLTTLAFAIHILFTQQIALALPFTIQLNGNITAFDGLLVINSTLLTLELFMVGLAIVVVSLIGVGQQLVYNNTYGYLWLLANVIGIVYILASKDWLITIAAGEVFNLSLYLLAGVIGLQYFLLSALATTLLILGCVIIYAFSGTLHYEGIIIIIAFVNVTLHYGSAINLLIVAMLLKLGVAPIHNWAPDLYSSLYLPVTFWFALLPKLAILGVLLQIPITLAPFKVDPFKVDAEIEGQLLLSTAILLGFVVGSIGLMGQWQIGRFLAYSAIVHLGYFLLALANGRTSYIFYAFIYGITVLNLFIAVHVMQSRLTVKQPFNLFLILTPHFAQQFRLPFAVSLFSLASIPPFAGFYAKLTVLAEGIAFLHWIAIFAVLASTLSAANYLSLSLSNILDLSFGPSVFKRSDSAAAAVSFGKLRISSPTITLILATTRSFSLFTLMPTELFSLP